MHLKELLSHRTRIVRQVEESYDELDAVRAKKRRIDLERQNIKKEINEEKRKKLENCYKLMEEHIKRLDIWKLKSGTD